MKRIFLLLIGISLQVMTAQVIVKMDLPPQAEQPLAVKVLFEEEVPEGMPVVLGLVGYRISGGVQPYSYEWIQNGKVVGTGDVVVITPAKGDVFELKATDKNKCHSLTSFSLKVIQRVSTEANPVGRNIRIYPSIVQDDVFHIEVPEHLRSAGVWVRFFDVKGLKLYETVLHCSTSLKHLLPDGIYFVSVSNVEVHRVEKIIVKH